MSHRGGGGQKSEKCQKSFTYYLNGPLWMTLSINWVNFTALTTIKIINHVHWVEVLLLKKIYENFVVWCHSKIYVTLCWHFSFFGAHIWQTAFGKKLTILSFNFAPSEWKQCWWNWTGNFSLNAVRRRLFAWQPKFGEIDPKVSGITCMVHFRIKFYWYRIPCVSQILT